MWICYGDIIYENLRSKLKLKTKTIQCVDCGEWFEVGIKDTKTERCSVCYDEHRKIYKAEKEKERRIKLRGQTK